jgi:hypothetical protein
VAHGGHAAALCAPRRIHRCAQFAAALNCRDLAPQNCPRTARKLPNCLLNPPPHPPTFCCCSCG